jgi:hypothetical protein
MHRVARKLISKQREGGVLIGSAAVFEAPAVVAGLDDIAVVRDMVEERGGHFGVAEDGGPLAEGKVGGDDDRGLLVELADQVEQELPAGSGERQTAQFIEHHEVEPAEPGGYGAGLSDNNHSSSRKAANCR